MGCGIRNAYSYPLPPPHPQFSRLTDSPVLSQEDSLDAGREQEL